MVNKEENLQSKRLNCIKCVHYFVTWDNRFPNGCKSMDFKSKNLPSVEVFNASGLKCQFYKEKIFKTEPKKD